MSNSEAPKTDLKDDSSLRSAVSSTKDIITSPDASILPNLENTTKTQKTKSYLFALSLVSSAILLAHLFGFSIFQFEFTGLGLAILILMSVGMLWAVGGMEIDWWELIWGYWWLSMPIAGASLLVLIRAQEGSNELVDVD